MDYLEYLKKPITWIIAFVLMVVIIILIIFSGGDEPVAATTTTTAPAVESSETTTTTLVTTDKEKSAEANPARYKEEKQMEFEQLIGQTNQGIKACQQRVATLFPEDAVDNDKLPYKTVGDLKLAIEEFYNLMTEKNQSTKKVLEYMTVNQSDLNPQKSFEKLSGLEDCGDFEEESINDAVIGYITNQKFTEEEKKSVAKFLLFKFQQQLNLDLGLHQIISKIETFDTMLDEKLLPEDLKEELNRINQLVEDTESDFRAMLPQSMGDKSYLTPGEIADIKNKEREITERLKYPLKELFELTSRRL